MKDEHKTLHDVAGEKILTAQAYALDGAFRSAARLYREVADLYDARANDVGLPLGVALTGRAIRPTGNPPQTTEKEG